MPGETGELSEILVGDGYPKGTPVCQTDREHQSD